MSEDLSKHQELQKEMLSRLKKIEGQIRGVQKMITDNRDCSEVVIQLAAIKAAVNRVGFSVLACHLADSIEESIGQGEDINKSMDEFMNILKKFS
ncbi:metal-sensitive transcriptional regulator [Desulforamulus aquiferis]|uniref:Metal-sensitive transcriptional regulator n=1 Tax=Desulforamulus aquiferis TaxID=1397668 RepID=A0AAW7ZCG2_9FIRM|nr:metal-sensitive transcriptional regulator [Desulforamulus aquiferis]MDO7786925.1 metal-sensitive transcriptional regulator [Desulforamulus aquiferis]RYD03955.1 hypothetical protein N752_17890 [Desulforamulus aquiferis]